LLRHGLGLLAEADAVHRAVRAVLDRGVRTADLVNPGGRAATTREMGERVADLVSHVVPVP
jgi:3-isopropylmalate dehydrogenase